MLQNKSRSSNKYAPHIELLSLLNNNNKNYNDNDKILFTEHFTSNKFSLSALHCARALKIIDKAEKTKKQVVRTKKKSSY